MSRSRHRDAPYWVHSQLDDEPQVSDNPPCPGRCNRAWRRAEADRLAELARVDAYNAAAREVGARPIRPVPELVAHGLEPIAGQPVWCRDCQASIGRDLGRLPGLAACLDRSDGRLNTGAGDTDRTRHGTRAGSPSGSPAWDTIDQVIRWAVDWEEQLRAHLAHAELTVSWQTLTASVRYLDAHLTAALCAPFAIQFGREAHQLAVLLEHAAGRDQLRHRLPAPCPSCDRRALVRDDGSEQVDCTACGRAWPESDYRRLTLILASDHREGRTG